MKNIKKYYNNYIGPLQYMVLVIFLSKSFFYGIEYSSILNISKYDSYISIILGFIIGFIPILLICYLNKKNTNLFTLIKSKIIKYIIILLIIFSFSILLNDLVNFINSKYLFDSSKLYISILFILPILYITNKDIESIGRSSLLIFYISIIIFIITTISLIKFIDINNLKPMFKTNINSHINSIIIFISYSIIPIIFLNIIPKNDNYKEYNKHLIIGYIISGISSIIIMFFITTTYNYEFISKFNYPIYTTIKKIEYDFISSPENIFSFYFIIDYFYSLLIYSYIIKYYLNTELKLKNKILNITYIIINILIIYLTYNLYKNNTITYTILDNLYYTYIILLIVIIMYFILQKINSKNYIIKNK